MSNADVKERKNILHLSGIIKRFYIGKPNELQILNGIDLDVHEGPKTNPLRI